MPVNLATLELLTPEIVLVVLASWMYFGGTILRSRLIWSLFALGAVGVAGVLLYRQTPADWMSGVGWMATYSGPVVSDGLSLAGRWIGLAVALLFVLIASGRAPRGLSSEYLGTLLLAATGLMLVSAANDLVLLFLGLELISIPTYVLLYLGMKDRATGEAAVKYFFLSILSSALFLYGLSFVYGMGGTTLIASEVGLSEAFHALDVGSKTAGVATFAPIAFVLVLAGLGFKMAAVPFHFYAADVYQGATNANAGLLAVLPKAAGVIGLLRLAMLLDPLVGDFAWQAILVISMLTMTIGNICALWQKNFRRLMAYSSIAHAGYMLIGLAVALAAAKEARDGGGIAGVSATMLYLVVYAFASIGSFAAAAWLSGDDRELNDVDELRGVGRTHPQAAAPLAVFMFSLAGIPPLAGFWGKFSLFGSAIQLAGAETGSTQYWFIALAVLGGLNAAIAAAYYLRIIAVMYFQAQPTRRAARGGIGALIAVGLCAAIVVLIGLRPTPAFTGAEQAGESVAEAPVDSGD